MPSSSAPSAAASAASFAALPSSVFASAIAPLLGTADLLAFASTSHAMRRLVVSPAVWRHRVFTSFPALPSASSLSSPSSLPSWCSVVQIVDMPSDRMMSPSRAPMPFASLPLFPNLRHVCGLQAAPHEPVPALAPLASLRHLTRVSLCMAGCLEVWMLRLLTTLPALASFVAEYTSFEAGSEETLREWQAVSASKRGTKRKAVGGEGEEGQQDGKTESAEDGADGRTEQQAGATKVGSEHDDAMQGEHHDDDEHDEEDTGENPNDPSLPQRYSPLLLFLHALAAKPVFVHLRLLHCDLTRFVLDHMPLWPHLLSLALQDDGVRMYSAAVRFPSLTSLISPSCTDAAIRHLVQLPQLEELRFPEYYTTEECSGEVQTTAAGFATFSQAASLRSVQYTPPEGVDEETPSLASLTALFTLAHLTRLTLSAWWMDEDKCVQLFTQHRFERLRCLELVKQYGCGSHHCPQTDAALLPLVKSADVVVPGRAERQAVRAARRARDREEAEYDGEAAVTECDIPAEGAASLPALECLVLPYFQYNSGCGDDTGEVSGWMLAQLRRSYEYEVVTEWEAECSTLGEAELLKAIA